MKGMNTTSRLNKHDFLLFALDELLPALSNFITLRFKEQHSVKEMREAMRYMFTIYPRLRSVVEPTLFSYRLKILDDQDKRLEVLFNDAFRVQYDLPCDTAAFISYRRDLLNEPFSLQEGLPIKIRYLPDDPQPVLFLVFHHMIADGRSWFHLETSLLRYLNGDKPPENPLDSPNMLPALVKKPYSTLPAQIYTSYRLFKKDIQKYKGQRMITASSRPADFFSPANAEFYILPFELARVKAKGKELDAGVNILLLAAFARTISRGAGRDTGDAIGIAIPIDLRPYHDGKPPVFGNFVSMFWVRIHRTYWDNPRAMIKEIKAQMYEYINRYKNKEMIVPNLCDQLLTLVGKKNYVQSARIAKKRGFLPMTCSYAAMGNIDHINSYGTKAQICETMSMVPHFALFMVTMSLEGRILTGLSYPEAEFTREEIKAFIQNYNQALAELLAL